MPEHQTQAQHSRADQPGSSAQHAAQHSMPSRGAAAPGTPTAATANPSTGAHTRGAAASAQATNPAADASHVASGSVGINAAAGIEDGVGLAVNGILGDGREGSHGRADGAGHRPASQQGVTEAAPGVTEAAPGVTEAGRGVTEAERRVTEPGQGVTEAGQAAAASEGFHFAYDLLSEFLSVWTVD